MTVKVWDNEITIDQRNSQVLMIEVYEIINGCIPLIIDSFFIFRENKRHNLRNFQIILNKTKIKKSKI